MTRRGEDALRSSPSVVLAFAPEGLPRPAPEENARASHLVGQHYLGDSAVSSRAPRQTARPISSFVRLHFIRLVAVSPALFHISCSPTALSTGSLDHGVFRRLTRLRGSFGASSC